MRLKWLLVLLMLIALAPMKAEATTYSAWYGFTDQRGGVNVPCRWRVATDVIYPIYGYAYRPTSGSGSSAKAYIPHSSWNVMRLEALSLAGLGSSFYSLVGDLRRWDTGGNFWRYFEDSIISGWYPPNEGPLSYERGFGNPYNNYPWYEWVYVSPGSEYHVCDATMSATSIEQGYATISAFERHIYYVRW